MDTVVGISPFFGRVIGLKRLRTMQTLLDRCFNVIYQIFSGNWVLELDCNVIYDLIQIFFKKRKYPRFIMLFVQEYALLHG